MPFVPVPMCVMAFVVLVTCVSQVMATKEKALLMKGHSYHCIKGEQTMFNWALQRMASRSRGQGMIEYGLIIALVAVVVIATLVLLGPQIARLFQQITGSL